MYTIYRLQLFGFSLHIDTIQPVMQGVFFIGFEDDGLLFLVESHHIHHHPWALGDLFQFLTTLVK